MPGLVIKPRARIFHGHDWVYASEVLKAFGDPQPGSIVSLKDGKDRPLGSAIYNPLSQIVARRFSRQRQDLDLDFFRRRIALAVKLRRRRGFDVETAPCRLVWSESDGLPGMIVDRYADVLVLQTLTRAMDDRKALIVEALVAELQPRAIIERNDAPVRRAEGMELVSGVLHGEAPGEVEIALPLRLAAADGDGGGDARGTVRFGLDLARGHKTGFYLDQVDNYALVAAHARGRRVLDCFTNQGAFALFCARAGATGVTAVEASADALAAARENARRNDLPAGNGGGGSVHWVEANVFDFLPTEERRGTAYDLIILDPPSFTKTKGRLDDALRGYKEIHLRALKLLADDGLLATFCCSHHVGEAAFREVIGEASVDARRSLRLLRRFGQSADHPVVLNLPETEYLHGYLFEAMPGR